MTTQFFNHLNGKIAYDKVGSGPLVICAPSLGDVRGEYRFLSPYLVAAGYCVVTLDLRGLGESSAQWEDYSVAGVGSDMVALIRHLNRGPAILVGTSMAAGAAVWAAAEAPECVAGLVLIGPFVRGETSARNALLYRVLFARPWGVASWQWYYASLYPTHKPADFEGYKTALGKNLKERGRLEALQQMMRASKAASAERVAGVHAPALVIMGSKDPDFPKPEEEAQWVAGAVKGRYVMIDGAGHYPHAEMPAVTAPLIVDFLQTLRTPEGVQHGA